MPLSPYFYKEGDDVEMPNFRKVMRFDSMPVPRAYFTPEGYLKDRPVLTSCGIFEYTNPDGSVRRELRLPEDVFSPESLRSYRGKPVVITHEAGLIDKNNVAENQIGTILSEGERSGGDVVAEIIIHDTDAMRSCGLIELSLGYNLDLDETPGVWNGQRYDAIQRNIRINHLALVREARAGEQARLNLDGRDQVNLLKGGKRMSKKNKRVPHADAVLSDEELDKALEEYDKKYGTPAEPEAQADAENEEEVVEEVPEEPVEPAPSDDVDEQVEMVKARRDKRDEEGDPEDVDSAMGMIAHQDEDIQTLLNIIDTLRARLDLGGAKADADDEELEEPVEDEPVQEEIEEDGDVDDLEKLKGDAEDEELAEEEPAEDEEFEEDSTDDEELPEGEDEVAEEEEEELQEDSADEEEDLPDEEDFEEDGCDDELGEKRMNADSVDKLVNMKIALGELGNKVGLRGLARKPVKEAKIAIIKATLPNARLDGKSDVYVNEAFKLARDTIRNSSKKTTVDQKKQMYNKKSVNMDSAEEGGSMAVRDRMIAKYSNRNK